jgi:hypothetical protein
MASLAIAPPAARLPMPAITFWLAGLFCYGGAALNFATGHFLDQASRDLWQHLAALQSLIADPLNPLNPFVPGAEGSRHFNPQWAGMALLARTVGWDAWQAIGLAGFVNAILLLVGIRCFGLTYYRSPWGPLALLVAMVLGWSLPLSHTGSHSLGTLIEGIAYPAVLLIALSLLLWTLIIRALERPRLSFLLIPLTALMMATHQLGAGIGLIVAAWFILLWPSGSVTARAAAAGAMAIGLLLSTLWPYHNPFEAIARAGNPTWEGGVDFYSPLLIWIATVPAAAGLLGLLHPAFRKRGLPILAAFLTFAGLFLLGLWDIPIATRFMMPMTLMLHIGLALLLIRAVERWRLMPKAAQLCSFAAAFTSIMLLSAGTFVYLAQEREEYRQEGSAYAAMRMLAHDIADQEPVAAHDVAAWPLAGTGQRVLSVPWPEPMIADLADRQRAVAQMFDPSLAPQERHLIARRWAVRTLIIDERGGLRQPHAPSLIPALAAQSVSQRQAGPYIRFDLY